MTKTQETVAISPAPSIRSQQVPSYHELTLARKSNRKELLELHGAAASAVFYWDATKSQFIDPSNVTIDAEIVASGQYVLQANIYNFHSSSTDMANLFKDNTNNLQLTFTAQTQQAGEEFTWIIKAGLSLASDFLSGSDSQSVALGRDPNQLTNFQAPQDQVVIQDGKIALWFGLAAQKKGSWWDSFLKAIGLIANSPLFAVVPMAKLASQTVSAVTQMTDQIETQNKLTQILQGNRLDCRISGSDPLNPFVLRSGFWLITNYDEVKQYIDYGDSENLKKNITLDMPSQQYDLVDSGDNHKPIDLTYAVIRISLTLKSS